MGFKIPFIAYDFLATKPKFNLKDKKVCTFVISNKVFTPIKHEFGWRVGDKIMGFSTFHSLPMMISRREREKWEGRVLRWNRTEWDPRRRWGRRRRRRLSSREWPEMSPSCWTASTPSGTSSPCGGTASWDPSNRHSPPWNSFSISPPIPPPPIPPLSLSWWLIDGNQQLGRESCVRVWGKGPFVGVFFLVEREREREREIEMFLNMEMDDRVRAVTKRSWTQWTSDNFIHTCLRPNLI